MLHGVIMAGGGGTRFWPESRKKRPKQLLNITGSKSMIRETVERILPEIPFERILVVTSEALAPEICEQLPELPPEGLACEPQARNTAACVALAAYKLLKKDPEGVMAVLPADHMILKEDDFLHALSAAVEAASSGDCLLTFGIVPSRPETGYGYILMGPSASVTSARPVYKVERFVEKPDRATAEQYLASGKYLWNSGMFVWKTSAVVKAFETHMPALSRAMEAVFPVLNTSREAEAIAGMYGDLESVSIDYGIMEKAENVLTLPIEVGWSDVGCWASLEDVWNRDSFGNAARGKVVSLDSRGCVVSSTSKLTVMIGVEDLIVVDTPDALLVCRKDSAQEVKKLQEILRQQGYEGLL